MLYTLATGICQGEALKIWKVVGYVLLAFKIVVPILLIIWGMLDLGKAVVASKDDEIKKATQSLAKRAVAGILVFFVPTLVGIIFGLVDGFNASEVKAEYTKCVACITNVSNCG